MERACKLRDNLRADFVDQILILFSILYSAAGYNLEYNIYTYTIAYLNIPRAFSAYHFPIWPRSIFRISNISQAYCYILLYIVIILGDMAIYCVFWGKAGTGIGGNRAGILGVCASAHVHELN